MEIWNIHSVTKCFFYPQYIDDLRVFFLKSIILMKIYQRIFFLICKFVNS